MKLFILSIALVFASLVTKAQAPKFGVFGGAPLYVNLVQEYTIPGTATEPAKAHISWTYTEDPSVYTYFWGVYRNIKNGLEPILINQTDLTVNSIDVPIRKDPKENVIVVLISTDHGASNSNQLKIRL